MEKISLLLVEDQKLLLDTIKNAFDNSGEIEVVDTLEDIALAKNILRSHPHIEVLFSDIITADNHNALDYIQEIKKEFPTLKIILITAFPELSFIEKAKNLKVDSFIYKNIPVRDLLSIVKNTCRGYSSFPNEDYDKQGTFKNLTDRELEILRLYCSGQDRKEIADTLFLSESTVKNYITEILLKTNYDSMAKLALYAVKNGFIL